jgi:hypothetical protein
MEQKQLDEVEDSFFGEEFIDDDNVIIEEVDAEDFRINMKESEEKSKKKTKKVKVAKVSKDASKGVLTERVSEPAEESVQPKVQIIHDEPKVEVVTESKVGAIDSNLPNDKDPWADDDEGSFFKDISTWKAITGILVILLVFSVFTQGFKFSDGTSSDMNTLSLSEAEQKALRYVNGNLLQAPFTAELVDSEDMNTLYRIKLSVAGQSVDSYLTKDGNLFFPQGFDTTEEFVAEPAPETDFSTEEVAEQIDEVQQQVRDELDAVEPPADQADVPVIKDSVQQVRVIPLNAKKWLFSPTKISAKVGDELQLNILPAGLDFTFSLPGYNVETEVVGQTFIQFVADKKGEFEFQCSSCEDWRGMTGILLVE